MKFRNLNIGWSSTASRLFPIEWLFAYHFVQYASNLMSIISDPSKTIDIFFADSSIQSELNAKFRFSTDTTDILSFNHSFIVDDFSPDEIPHLIEREENHLGCISLDLSQVWTNLSISEHIENHPLPNIIQYFQHFDSILSNQNLPEQSYSVFFDPSEWRSSSVIKPRSADTAWEIIISNDASSFNSQTYSPSNTLKNSMRNMGWYQSSTEKFLNIEIGPEAVYFFHIHIPRLLTHSLLHLIGHDHESDSEFSLMMDTEKESLIRFYSNFPNLKLQSP